MEGGGIREACSGAVGLLCTVWLSRFSLRRCINTTSASQQPYFIPHIQPLKMELIECSETSAYCNFNQTPGKYPKEYIHLDINLFVICAVSSP